MKENIQLLMRNISSRTNKLKSLYIFDKMSKHSNVKDGQCFQFQGIFHDEWIVVSSILEVTLLV
jgi:hypothetical protein